MISIEPLRLAYGLDGGIRPLMSVLLPTISVVGDGDVLVVEKVDCIHIDELDGVNKGHRGSISILTLTSHLPGGSMIESPVYAPEV